MTHVPQAVRSEIRRLRRLHQGGARSPLDPPLHFRHEAPHEPTRAGPRKGGEECERDYIIPFRAFLRASFFTASASVFRFTDGFSYCSRFLISLRLPACSHCFF